MIRPAKPDDLPEMLEMGRAFHREAGYADSIEFCETTFTANLTIFGQADLLLVLEDGGEVVGMAAADVAPSICNYGVRIGQEAFWYIKPDHRRGHGKRLLAALECAAKSQGAALFYAVAEDGERASALARIYRAAGYSPRQQVFVKDLQGGC